MARELEKQAVFEIISAAGIAPPPRQHRTAVDWIARLRDFPDLRREIDSIYQHLGGHEGGVFRPGAWDIECELFLVEFDEEQHFNRYRSATLREGIYSNLPLFPLTSYLSICEKFEKDCLKKAGGGKYWTSDSTEKQFGPSAPPKILEGRGSARWKQRAFYDLLKDICPLVGSPPVVRLGVWEGLEHVQMTVREALARRGKVYDEAILRLIVKRSQMGSGVR